MNGARRKLLGTALKLFDVVALTLVLAVAAALQMDGRRYRTVRDILSLQITLSHGLLFLLLLVIWHGAFCFCGMYESKRLASTRDLLKEIALATALSTLSLALAEYAASAHNLTIRTFASFWLLGTALLLASRLLLRHLLGRLRRNGRNLRHILILGTNARAKAFAARIGAIPELGYRVVGFADQLGDKQTQLEGHAGAVRCDLAGLEEFLRWHVVDEIAMYLPLRSLYEHAAHVASVCEQHGIMLRLAPNLFNLKLARTVSEELDGETQIAAVTGAGADAPLLLKRAFDFSLSAILLIISSPLLLAISLLLWASSPGPVLFRQKRLGLNRRQFVMYKFRTMIPAAEQLQDAFVSRNEMSGPVFKIHDDPRITAAGRILRKSSLDELPQLWNVLRGEMSLVGPRAMSVRDYSLFPQGWQRRRFSVRPGITCLWQVNGRNSLGFDTWMEMDMEYIDRWSLWLDLKILARTIPAVIKGTGAA